MPVRIILKCGRELFITNASYASLVAGSIMGVIKLVDDEGDDGFLTKSEIAYAKQIDPAKYKAQIEAHKKAAEDQAAADEKARSDAEAKKKSDDAAAATLALLESKTLRGRIRKLLHVKKG